MLIEKNKYIIQSCMDTLVCQSIHTSIKSKSNILSIDAVLLCPALQIDFGQSKAQCS